MRYVFTTGTVTPTDMPDHDARDSFFENVILSGNFTGYDFRNVSFSRCLVVGDWSGALTEYSTSWQSDWSKCILPRDAFGAYSLPPRHDFMAALIRQRAGALSPARRTAAQGVADHLAADHATSWRDSLYWLKTTYGLTNAQLKTMLATVFQNHPALVSKVNAVVGGSEGSLSAILDWVRPAEEPLEIRSRIDLLRDPRLTGEDRRGIELVLEADASGHRVHLYTLHPWPMGVAALVTGTPHWNWWD